MKASEITKAKELLTSADLKITKSRMSIVSVLLHAEKPLTQNQIVARLKNLAPDKVTVYRTLQTLLDVGFVHRVLLPGKNWTFELSHHCSKHQCHPHFTCVSCGSTNCFMDMSLPMARKVPLGFMIYRQSVHLEGLCPDCCHPKKLLSP